MYPRTVVREWLDITTAARERFGPGFFKRSPQAYLVDNLRHATAAGRTPPDWWHDLRSRERQQTRSHPTGLTPADPSASVLRRIAEAAFPTAGGAAPVPPAPVPALADILRSRR
jgi:hypothetical protein